MKNWNQVLEDASEFVIFLQSGHFFSEKFESRGNYKIIEDANIGIDYATNDSFDNFDEWETVTDTVEVFPIDFEWNESIKYKLNKKAILN